MSPTSNPFFTGLICLIIAAGAIVLVTGLWITLVPMGLALAVSLMGAKAMGDGPRKH